LCIDKDWFNNKYDRELCTYVGHLMGKGLYSLGEYIVHVLGIQKASAIDEKCTNGRFGLMEW
jgi:hypothetical protein